MKYEFPQFYGVRVLVIGDVMLDSFCYGTASRLSPEAPVPVVKVKRLEYIPGGAANVAMNIASLGASCQLGGITGIDFAATKLQELLVAGGIECVFHQTVNNETIVKQRIISNHQQLLRIDFEGAFANNECEALMSLLEPMIEKTLVMVLSDYDKGTLSNHQYWISLAKRYNVPVLVDPKGVDFEKYNGASLITPNMVEFETIVGKVQSEADLIKKARYLIELLDIKAILITRSEHGMSLIQKGQPEFHLQAAAREVFDITGAGDTVISTIAAVLAAGRSLKIAVTMASIAASIVVKKWGTATVSSSELQVEYQRHQAENNSDYDSSHVVTLEQLKLVTKQAKQRGEKIVFTNGCFDILHAGHVSYLEQARSLGDLLVVAINTDESVTKLKGGGRPVNTARRRLIVLTGLGVVDWATCFEGDTPEDLLREIEPDILVKGGNYNKEGVVGWEIVEGYGGEVLVMGETPNCSTTAIVDKINDDIKK